MSRSRSPPPTATSCSCRRVSPTGSARIEPNTELVYKVSRYYSREHDLGLAWDDPALGIAWPVGADAAVLSDKDRRQPTLAELPAYFRYEPTGAMKLLILGAAGQVGHELCRRAWPAGTVLAAFGRDGVDIARREAVAAAVARERPDIVVNAAAYTAVDRAEIATDRAWAGNCTGPLNLAATCRDAAIPLIHISTDYVFDGSKIGPYREDDPVRPLGAYGQSKEAGERAVRDALAQHVILRTAWVYSAHGNNFVKTMLRLAGQYPVLRVVADQVGSPTAAADIAAAIGAVVEAIAAGNTRWGTYHFAGGGAVTWHGFAEAIFELATPWRGQPPRVDAITTAEFPTPTRRPANSVLDCGRIGAAFGIVPRPWRTALADVIGELGASAAGS